MAISINLLRDSRSSRNRFLKGEKAYVGRTKVMLGDFHIVSTLSPLLSRFVVLISITQQQLSHRRCPTLIPHGDKEMRPPSLRGISGYSFK